MAGFKRKKPNESARLPQGRGFSGVSGVNGSGAAADGRGSELTPSNAMRRKNAARGAKAGSIGRIDIPFLILVLVLTAFGLIMVASASYVYGYYEEGDSYFYIKKQLLFAVAGIAVMFGVAFFDYHRLRKYAFPLLCVSVVLLILVLIPGIGKAVGDARRWLDFGVRFQPSEIGKFAIVISFASYISANYKNMNKFKVGVLPLLVMLGTVVFLVAIETHLSGAIVIMAVGAIMMFVGGVQLRYFAMALGAAGAGFTVLILFTGYMTGRIKIWARPVFRHGRCWISDCSVALRNRLRRTYGSRAGPVSSEAFVSARVPKRLYIFHCCRRAWFCRRAAFDITVCHAYLARVLYCAQRAG